MPRKVVVVESRQVRRAKVRQAEKYASPKYPMRAQKDLCSKMKIHKNRRDRNDGHDYF